MGNLKFELGEIAFVYLVTIDGVDSRNLISKEVKKQQLEKLNNCLSEYPKGQIIAIDKMTEVVTIDGKIQTIEKVTYHVGFTRKPHWLEESIL